MRFDIKSVLEGHPTLCSGAPKYHGVYMSPSYLEFQQIASPTLIHFTTGDYVDYTRTGMRYRLYSLPQPQRKAGNGLHGESFVYSNVCFYAESKVLELAPFHDLAYNASQAQYYFSSNKDFSLVAHVSNLAERIQANLNLYAGADTWRVMVQEDLVGYDETEDKTISFSGSCLDALQAIYDNWYGLGWTFKYTTESGVTHPTIVIGGANVRSAENTTNEYRYKAGFVTLKRNQANKDNFCTRMRVFGSTRNMPSDWYNRQDIYNAANVHIPNLMIPLSYWGTSGNPAKPDAQKAYFYDDVAESWHGVIEKSVYFDGTDNNEEIYPSISKTTIADLKSAKTALGKTGAGKPDYYPQDADGTKRIDVVNSVVNPTDSGDTGTSSSLYIEDISVALNASGSFPQGETIISLGTHTYTHGGRVLVEIGSPMVFRSSYTTLPIPPSVRYKAVCGDRESEWYQARVTRIAHSSSLIGNVAYFDSIISLGDADDPIASGSTVEVFVSLNTTDSNGDTYSINQGVLTWRMKAALRSTFEMHIRQIGVDLSTCYGSPVITMTSGACSARDFTINKIEYEGTTLDTWKLILNRYADNEMGKSFPNSNSQIAVGDTFVITGIEMPEEYISMASSRLYTAGLALFDKQSVIQPLYEPTLDSKWIAEQMALHPSDESYVLREGKYMTVYDLNLVEVPPHYDYIIIDSLTISEDESNIPVYSVVLRDTKASSLTQSMSSALRNVNARISNVEQTSQRTQSRDSSESGGKINGVRVSTTYYAPDSEKVVSLATIPFSGTDNYFTQSHLNFD